MKRLDVKKLVIAALLSSFVCVATMIIQIPNGIGGYFNLGDCIVLLCGWLLGPLYGAFAAGIGSMLADIFASYVAYAPITFIIKALMAVVAYYILKSFENRKRLGSVIGGICAEFLMALGYLAYESYLYGFAAAALGVVPNLLQGIAGIASAMIIKEFIDRKKLWKY